ncbi:MAG: dienelactone hydrolase family protein [Sedimentisphaerales bacterium]|nr:dienelactone hydrolase family protein [Sedimentisphaerales bacterium]
MLLTVSQLYERQNNWKGSAMNRTFTILCVLMTLNSVYAEQAISPLQDTRPLEWQQEDLSERLMDGAHQFIERQIQQSRARRAMFWKDDSSIAENRRRFREIIGAVDSRLPVRMERFGDDTNPAQVAETAQYSVFQVRWSVLEGVFGEGLIVEPKQTPVAQVVVVPDADQTPEQLLGLAPGIESKKQFARHLANNGFRLVIPTLVGREKLDTNDAALKKTDQTYREWIYRQAFHMGRHIIGYEVQKVLAAVDWFEIHDESIPIGVVGYAEGGLIAFYAAAIDTRIDAVLVSGYFDAREKVWAEPIYRNVWSLLRRFGDAEIASLILPRSLVVEYSPTPTVTGHKGDWRTPDFTSVSQEFRRISTYSQSAKPTLIHEADTPIGPGSIRALKAFTQGLGIEISMVVLDEIPRDRRALFNPDSRHKRTVRQLENHVQSLVRQSEHVRDRFFLYDVMPEFAERRWSTKRRHATHSVEKFVEGAKPFRERFYAEGMGCFEEPLLAPNARSHQILDTKEWKAYDVVLDVFPELFAWGVLVLPKDIQPGERRPVVVCQHGRNGVPRSTLDANSTAYNNFAARLAERGFITFAPHNLYRGEDRYRWLDRKANTVRATLFSFIIAQHDQILRWLSTLPFVDSDRIAFYGLSYGGETAVRVPAILEKYCLSICSGDFNQWTRKVAATDQPFSFMRTIEWEMPYWNLGHTFDYAEMAYLMVPRPFMVERGHLDLVGRDHWVAHEYAKVRWLYAQLGIDDRTEIEFFQGGHSINGEGTFAFLHKHLDWPEKAE